MKTTPRRIRERESRPAYYLEVNNQIIRWRAENKKRKEAARAKAASEKEAKKTAVKDLLSSVMGGTTSSPKKTSL